MLPFRALWVILNFTLYLNQGEKPETWHDAQIILKCLYYASML